MNRILFYAIWLSLLVGGAARAQIQIGTITGVVTDPNGARIAAAQIVIADTLGQRRAEQRTDARGEFRFDNLPFTRYELRVSVPGFQPSAQTHAVHSNLPLQLEFKLNLMAATASAQVSARNSLLEPDSPSTTHTLAESFIRRVPGATGSLSVQKLIATTPGWTTQNNGLLHVRGVDDGILYVIDGIPTVDRLDAASASNFDTGMIRSLHVITGNLSAEFGGRSGAVVQIQPRSGLETPLTGGFGLSGGGFRAREFNANAGGSLGRAFGVFATASGTRTDRFLDPVDLGNFHNRGGALKFNQRTNSHGF